MSKVALIGIDGLDPYLLGKWRDSLPNMSALYNDVNDIIVESTFPPDSICAWASIYTGENPAEHGLIESIDYLSSRKSQNNENRSALFQGKTFWDIAGRNGKTVCIINPFIAYPAWKVNGIMISGPVFEGGVTSVYPFNILDGYDFPPLGGMVDFPEEKDLGDFISNARELTEKLAEVSLQMYRDYDSDIYFLTFLTLDRIKHFIWRFTDQNDIYYPGENPYENVIKDFYVLFDKIIGDFMESMSDDTSLMVISDHGHRRRCQQCLNLNEILRQKGYLKTTGNGASGAVKKLIEKTKVFAVGSLSRFGLQDWIYKIAKFVPNHKALKKSTYLIDREASSVILSDLCGTNPYGGFDIKSASKDEYEVLREKIIRDLLDINKTYSKDIVKWVKKRELVYHGKFEERLPNVMFELHEDYGVGMDLFSSIITENYTHRKISGGHKREAVLLLDSNKGQIRSMKRPETVVGIKDYILEILND